MIVTRLETDEKSKKTQVYIDGEYSFFLTKKEYNQYKLSEGQFIDDRLYAEIIENIIYPRAREKALSLLDFSDRTESELKNKLIQAGYTDEIIAKVMDFLKLYDYINDERYAQTYIRSSKKSKSRLAIMTSLLKKGIDGKVIDKALYTEYNDSSDDELDAIKRIIAKKAISVEKLNLAQKQKIMASLYRKGFNPENIRRILE